MGLPEFQALAVDGLDIPRSIMQKVMQPLALGIRNQGRQLDERLVVLAWQQESNEILAEGLPLLPSSEQQIKRRDISDQLLRRSEPSACGEWASERLQPRIEPLIWNPPPPSLAAGSVPDMINQRLSTIRQLLRLSSR